MLGYLTSQLERATQRSAGRNDLRHEADLQSALCADAGPVLIIHIALP
jgi:hypothetical protein